MGAGLPLRKSSKASEPVVFAVTTAKVSKLLAPLPCPPLRLRCLALPFPGTPPVGGGGGGGTLSVRKAEARAPLEEMATSEVRKEGTEFLHETPVSTRTAAESSENVARGDKIG